MRWSDFFRSTLAQAFIERKVAAMPVRQLLQDTNDIIARLRTLEVQPQVRIAKTSLLTSNGRRQAGYDEAEFVRLLQLAVDQKRV